MVRALSIRALLLGAHAFVWILPLIALLVLRVYDVYLLRQTEHQLIAESVVIGEVYREAWLRQQGRTNDDHQPRAPSEASGATSRSYHPIAAQVDFDTPVLGRQTLTLLKAVRHEAAALSAGAHLAPLLERAQTFNLSAIRVLDGQGCVVATTGSELGLCMGVLPEVKGALAGKYASVLRERISDEPAPPFGDIRRRGTVRVFTALPVISDGKVIGVVRASRTGLDALSSLWANRRGLLWTACLGMALMVVVSIAFSTAIARPLSRLTRAARAVAQGAPAQTLADHAAAPREIAVLREVLFKMALKLEGRAAYVERFASQVSHELKTPITAIRGAAELLAQGIEDMPEADRARFIDNIVEDAHRMERLVGRLLELARLENAPADQAEPLDLAEAARKLLARHGERVVLEVEATLPSLRISAELFASVLSNLVDNGLRHGAPHAVRVTLRAEGERVRIDVHDRGPGVSEANRRRLFERFFTTERDHGGTGLGLTIVKVIAEARGGSVSAQFDDEGTTFSVLL